MKTTKISLSILAVIFSISLFGQTSGKLVSSKAHVKFFSHTSMEDIEANNFASVGTINTETGDVVFSLPMQSFEFDIAKMQQHFNSKNFLDTKSFPKSKLKAKITNVAEVDFTKEGTYPATVVGELTIKGVTNPVNVEGNISIKDGLISIESKFKVTLADYGITFLKGKPSTNVAKEVEVTVLAEFASN